MALADDKGEPFYRAFSVIMDGLIAIAEGGAENGIEQTSAALVAYRATGARLLSAHVLAYLAKALAERGRFDEARQSLGDAIATISATEERWCESDITRTAGEVALLSSAHDASAAERYFERALAIARAQNAKGWELRAATSLARLRGHVGRRAEALALLASLRAEFVEGFDTRDLIEASATLRELEGRDSRLDAQLAIESA